MSLEGAGVSLGATIVSVAFAALVFNQWIARRKPYQLAWSLGLGLYAAAAFLQFLAEAYGWSVATYKVYYLIAALLVAVLGIGSTILLHRRGGLTRSPQHHLGSLHRRARRDRRHVLGIPRESGFREGACPGRPADSLLTGER